jgi:hypothetical protein
MPSERTYRPGRYTGPIIGRKANTCHSRLDSLGATVLWMVNVVPQPPALSLNSLQDCGR